MWDWMEEAGRAENRKLMDKSAAEDQARRDDEAMERLEEGQHVKTPDGWIGTLVEKYPSEGKVYVETWMDTGTYRASRVKPVSDNSLRGGL